MHDGGGGGNAVCSEYPQTDSQYAYMVPSDHVQVCPVHVQVCPVHVQVCPEPKP
jgi:hypothetical protein